MLNRKLEQRFHSPGFITNITQGLDEYRLGKKQAEDYLSRTLFTLAPIPTPDKRARMIKLAATTLLMQRLYCRLFGHAPTQKLEEKFLLIGAMIDPYDGVQDSPNLENSVQFCADQFQVFAKDISGRMMSQPTSDDEARFYAFLPILEREVPRSEFPGFWKVLKSMHAIQTISLMQRIDVQKQLGIKLSANELFEISSTKGGLNAILFASLIDSGLADTVTNVEFPPDLSLEEVNEMRQSHITHGSLYLRGHDRLADAIYATGALVQLVDDFEDVPDDVKAGIQTAFTSDSKAMLTFLRNLPFYLHEISSQFLAAGKSREENDMVLQYLELYIARKILKRLGKFR